MVTSGVSTQQEALSALAWAGEVVRRRLRASLDEFCPAFRTVAGYHLGWCDAAGEPVSTGGGKAVRPALVLLTAKAVGGVDHGITDAVTDAAVAVELVHNFSLVHDDVMDGDECRRHRPTVWALFGVPTAILVGDALLSAAQQVLVAADHPAAMRALAVLSRSVQHMLHGQAMDVGFESRQDVGPDETVAMTEGKTAALMRCACEVGALYAGAEASVVAGFREFGRHLGMAFQYVDDLLGIWGDPTRTGKPVWSDLRSRKKSLPVVAALCSGTAAGRELARVYRSREVLSADRLATVADLVVRAGGRDWARTRAERHLADALSCLDVMDVDPQARRSLVAVAHLVAAREL